ncbi:aldo/keto reductase, partial [Halomonas sp. NO4]|uniref:aldo/keto reductase n=1 Tax=Halomonas sp. NO4 TaxID=2484813 RepID=UPI0013D54057
MPRFSAQNYPKNLSLLADFTAVAQELDVRPSQLALAWLRAKGDDIIPIPGTRSIEHMRENLAAEPLRLDAASLSRLDVMMTPNQVVGSRYGEAQQAEIDTEEFG